MKLLDLYTRYYYWRNKNPHLEDGNILWSYGNSWLKFASFFRLLRLDRLDKHFWNKAESYHKMSSKWFDEQWDQVKKQTGKKKEELSNVCCPSHYLQELTIKK